MRLFQIPSFCLSVQEWSEGIQRDHSHVDRSAQVPAQSTSVPVVIPKVEEEKRTRMVCVWLSSINKNVAFVERICKVKET